MGVLHGRDLFSTKFITAEIKDASKRLHYVPIKHTIGDYFLTYIDNQLYCFKIDNEICQYRETLTKSFRVIQYDTTHYRPVHSDVKMIEQMLAENDLPKINMTLANIFKLLGAREKAKKFTPHNLDEIIQAIEGYDKSKIAKIIPKNQSYFANLMSDVINYLNNLDVKEIVTPVRGISNFLEDNLISTDPHFEGTVLNAVAQLDFENKKVTNYAITAKKGWLKVLAVVALIAVVLMALYLVYDSGGFDFITTMIPDLSNVSFAPSAPPQAASSLAQKYPTVESAKAAVDRGEVSLSAFPPQMQEEIKRTKTPEAKIEIGG